MAAHRQLRVALQPLGQAEVGDERLILRVDEHVGRLEVTMENAMLMGIVDRLGDGLHVASGTAGGQRVPANQNRQTLPLHVIHRDEMLARAKTDFVDGDNVGMMQRRRRHRLSPEALHRLWQRVRSEQEQLEGDYPVQASLAGLINDPHAAVPNLLEQFVVAEGAELRQSRGRAGWRPAVAAVELVLRRGLRYVVKAQPVKAAGTETLGGVGGKLRTATRTSTDS